MSLSLRRPAGPALIASFLLVLGVPLTGHANSQTLTFLDGCQSAFNAYPAGYSVGPPQLKQTTVAVSTPTGVPQFREANDYTYSLSLTSGGTTVAFPAQACDVDRTYQISNTPGGAGVGTTIPEENVDPDDVPGWLEQFFTGANNLIEQNFGPKPEAPGNCDDSGCVGGGGIRGKLFLQNGVELSEASPAYVAFQPAALITGPIAIPFIVEAPGIGDSLSMYFGATQFFKQPLASFTIGQLYFASLPVPGGPASNPAITLWLDSTGSNGAKVYFPTAAQVVPAPPALVLLATAVAGLGWRRLRARPGN